MRETGFSRNMGELYGKYRGRVEDNLDPANLGRVQVSSPSAFGAGVRRWALPCLPYTRPGHGFTLFPPVGTPVWIEFEAGDLDSPIWSGCFWESGTSPWSDPDDVVVSTRGGHRLTLSDSANEISLVHANGSTVQLDSTGRIRVITNGVVEISASAVDVSAATATLSAGIVKASGAIECDALIANSVAATSYTPGRGNVE